MSKTFRTITLIYILGTLGFAIASVLVPFSPGIEVAGWFAYDDGSFPLFQVIMVLAIMFWLPMAVVILVTNKIRVSKVRGYAEPVDQTGIEVTREKSLYAAIHSIDIYVNDIKRGSVMNGKTARIPLPYGEQIVFAKSMGKTTAPIHIAVSAEEKAGLVVGFELTGQTQQLFLKKK